MKAIVAMSENRVIGAAGGIPWHFSEDLRFFKKTTLGHPIVMGRKTYESLGRPLPGRKNIVLSRTMPFSSEVTVVRTIEDLQKEISSQEELFVIGGAEIYQLFLPYCDTLFVTHVHGVIEGDTFFPPFEKVFTAEEVVLETADFITRKYCRS